MNTLDKNIANFEKIMNKASIPIALFGSTFLIGRTLVSFLFGI